LLDLCSEHGESNAHSEVHVLPHSHVVCIHLSAQQPDLLTDFEISGRVYEPQPIPPTDERIQRLSLPSGFVVHRFAEGLESPRMIATTAESRSR
jgi:hypothetical protein